MSDPAYRNFESYEGEIEGSSTITFNKKSRHIMLMNDSNHDDLQFRFTTAEAWGTLKASETLSLNLTEEQIILRSVSDAPTYRLWVFG
jgi:hypothetical protein